MSLQRKKYKECKLNRIELSNKLITLQEDPTVQDYINTLNKYEEAKEKENELYKEMKFNEYEECNHILIPTREESHISRHIRRNFTYCGCIKCGLNEAVHSFIEGKKKNLTKAQELQYEYLSKNEFRIKGIEIDITCGLALAHDIYKGIKEEYPDITDEETVKLFNRKFTELKEKYRRTEIDKPKIKQK